MNVRSLEQRTFWVAWGLAVAWNGLLSFGLFAILWNHPIAHPGGKNLFVLFVLFVPFAIGIGLLIWAIRQTMLWNAYGETYFVSEADTFFLGNRLYGKIQVSRSASRLVGRPFRLRILCQVEIFSPAGDKGRSTQTIWSDVHSVDIEPDGTIPILFVLPAEVEPKVFAMSISDVSWILKVNQVGGGLRSFAAEYILPVQDNWPRQIPIAE